MAVDKRSAFTLIEMSLVLVVLSLMLAGALAVMTQQTRIANNAELKEKMDAIEEAIIAYSKRDDSASSSSFRLPCPARDDLAMTNTAFGVAAFSPCGTLMSALPLYVGAVPVKTLGLPDEYAFDPWGNQFKYAVGNDAATDDALITAPIGSTALDIFEIRNINDVAVSTGGIMILISHGPNGFGAFTPAGIRKSGYSTNAMEQVNSNCDADCSTITSSSIYYQGINVHNPADANDNFDDVVRYYERGFFKLTDDYILE